MWEAHTMYYQVTTKNGYSFKLDEKPYSEYTVDELLHLFRGEAPVIYGEFCGNVGRIVCVIDDEIVEEATFDDYATLDGFPATGNMILYPYDENVEKVHARSLKKGLALQTKYFNSKEMTS